MFQVYRGTETSFVLDSLQCKSDYHVRVCAIRQSNDDSEIVGAFSPGQNFSTLSPEPVKPVISQISDSKDPEPKQLTDQQLAAIFVAGLVLVAVLIAFIAQQFISYTSGMSRNDLWQQQHQSLPNVYQNISWDSHVVEDLLQVQKSKVVFTY